MRQFQRSVPFLGIPVRASASLVNIVGHAMVYENVSLLVECVSHDQEVGGIPDSGLSKDDTKKG